MRKLIDKAKKEGWNELLEGLNRDPWGRPYRLIMNKISTGRINVCEELPGKVVGRILGELFPRDRGVNFCAGGRSDEVDSVPKTTPMEYIIKRPRRKGNKAPGPDGVQARIMVEHTRVQKPCTGGWTMDA